MAASTSLSYLEAQGVRAVPYESVEATVEALAQGEVDAVVYDAPILRWLVRERYAAQLQVLPRTFERQDYAIGLPQGSPLREPLNRLLLEAIDSGEWERLVTRYLGEN